MFIDTECHPKTRAPEERNVVSEDTVVDSRAARPGWLFASGTFLLVTLFLTSSLLVAQQRARPQVINSILGVGIGTTFDQAHAKLDRLRKGEKGDTDEQENEEREGGHKELWSLMATHYTSVALQTDQEGRVVWITGFVRPGEAIPFAKLGNISLATTVTESRATWNVATPGGGYRLIARGQNGKALVISMLSLSTPPVQ
jgi:hypothetical protein